jgi:6-phosphogluconate dehydrogenase
MMAGCLEAGMDKADIGIIGLGVMGANLALNLSDKGFGLSVYNRTRR